MKIKTIAFIISIIVYTANAGAASNEITIIYSGSSNGVLESCQCPGNLYGGLVNRLAAIDSLRKIYPEAIVIDLGDFLPALPDSLKSRYIVKAMDEFAFDAIGVGDQEFVQGKDFIIDSDLPLISLCLTEPVNGKHLFITGRTMERQGNLVWLTSLIKPELFRFYPDSIANSIKVSDPETTLKEYRLLSSFIPDLTIVLSHMGYDNDINFLKQNPDIDVLFSGHSQVLLNTPEKHGETILAAPGKNGEDLGVLHLKISGKGKISGFTHEMIPLKAEIVGESIIIRQLINEYNEDLREELRRKAIAGGRKFKGTSFCAECHQEEYEDWKKSVHAGAYETIHELGKYEESNCIDCHTTGFGYPGGFDNIETTPDMAGVGCEECHRIPKSENFEGGEHHALPVIDKWCTRCHKEPHIISFDFKDKRSRIDHSGK